ncbi:MAG: protein phosphatase CheZ, partial [Bdellovibrionales bacterium]|nr:protein phosphatase CheZ [Bdellovibrionales bacterium]
QLRLALDSLGVDHQSSLRCEMESLAHRLHGCLAEFKKSLSTESPDMHSTTIRDAGARLERVLELTFDAANTVLDVSEEQETLYQSSRKELESVKLVFDSHAEIPDAVALAFQSYYDSVSANLAKCTDNNQRIFISQNFQDLSGQTLKKVIKLVQDIEGTLDQLLKLFGSHETAIVSEEQPSASGAEGDNSDKQGAIAQEDADELLKEFGF